MKDPGPAVGVAVFRARRDGARSAARLRKLGFRVACLPVVEITSARAEVTVEGYDAVVASSAKAFMADAPGAPVAPGPPLYVVGALTARAAGARGWRLAAPPARDSAWLVETMRRELPTGARVLYLAGRDRKSTLETVLGGFCALEVVEVYSAEARASWRPAEIRALASCAAALHYSRRSAALAARLAEASGLAEHFLGLRHFCLSDDVAGPLRATAASFIVVAERPEEVALIEALAAGAAVFASGEGSRI